MKKTNRKNTVKAAAVNEAGNTATVQQAEAPVTTPEVQAPAAEKATQDQLKLIGRAVKSNKIGRFDKEAWATLTKAEAAEIIEKNHLEEDAPAETPVQEVKTVTIKDPDAKATRAQLQLIGHAVKQGRIGRFDEEKWKRLTKGEASAIIDRNNLAADDGTPASAEQKQKLSELVKEGFLAGFGNNLFKKLTKKAASQFIRWGLYRKDQGVKAERRQFTAPAAAQSLTPALAAAGTASDEIDYNDIPF